MPNSICPAAQRAGSDRGTSLSPAVYRKRERGNSASRGFTLIEILVVVVILGILAAIVVPRVMERPGEEIGRAHV